MQFAAYFLIYWGFPPTTREMRPSPNCQSPSRKASRLRYLNPPHWCCDRRAICCAIPTRQRYVISLMGKHGGHIDSAEQDACWVRKLHRCSPGVWQVNELIRKRIRAGWHYYFTTGPQERSMHRTSFTYYGTPLASWDTQSALDRGRCHRMINSS
jgi:hypothetical protein